VWRRNHAAPPDETGEVDAKSPTPPNKNPDSDKPINEVAFSGSRKPPTPSLKTPQPEPNFTKKSVPTTGTPWQKEAASGKQFEDAVSVTAHPAPPSDGSSTKHTPPPMPSTTPPQPLAADLSKKKVEELLEQSVASKSE
ncbi:hypothetical protein PENTCL1PPCAC_5495, partial [Pristionchus entomophagus]